MNELDLFRDFRRGAAPPSGNAKRRASTLLATAVAGAHISSTRRRRLRAAGGRRRRLVLVAAAALVALVGTATAFSTVRGFILDRGFVGLPPEGATPSAPESGELVLQWDGRSATHARPDPKGFLVGPHVRAWVYADGRMIWSRSGSIPEGANELTSGYLEQRLTPEGAELLRSEVVQLFQRSRVPLETVTGDSVPGPFRGFLLAVAGDASVSWGSLKVRDGDRAVGLQWEAIGAKQGTPRFREILDDLREHRSEVSVATAEQLSALRRVDALVTEPESVLPSSAWAVRKIRAYVPSYYEVCIDTSPPKDLSQLLSLLPTASADVLRGKSMTRSEGDVVEAREEGRTVVLGRSVSYCAKLATEEAREVADPLSGFDGDRRVHGVMLAYQLAEAVDNLNPTAISFEPYFPHGKVTCSACG